MATNDHAPRRHRLAAILALGAFAALTAVLMHPPPGNASPVKRNAVVSSSTSAFGRVLVDRRGRTLYLFEKDAMGKSSCAGPCATYWPPLLTTGRPLAGSGIRAPCSERPGEPTARRKSPTTGPSALHLQAGCEGGADEGRGTCTPSVPTGTSCRRRASSSRRPAEARARALPAPRAATATDLAAVTDADGGGPPAALPLSGDHTRPAASNPSVSWVPSQNGFVPEPPQRQRQIGVWSVS